MIIILGEIWLTKKKVFFFLKIVLITEFHLLLILSGGLSVVIGSIKYPVVRPAFL